MTCIRPKKFDSDQLAKCHICKHASRKKIWCCLHGIAIIETGKVIIPERKPIITGPPTIEQMEADYKRVFTGTRQNDRQCVSWQEYLRRREICIKCAGGYKCPHHCCGIEAQLAKPDWVCKENRL